MNNWPRWVGDWKKKTAHLSLDEKGAYGELLDFCYVQEQPLPLDSDSIYRLAGATNARERAAVDRVLRDFFIADDAGFHNPRALQEIEKRKQFSAQQSELALRRWAKQDAKKQHKPPGNGELPAAPNSIIWDAYATAYRERYGVGPTRNARVNGQVAHFAKRVPAEDAPKVAAFYVRSNRQFYVAAKHPIAFLLRDAESLRTEFLTGSHGTETEARRTDKTQALGNAFAPLIAEAEEREKNGSQ